MSFFIIIMLSSWFCSGRWYIPFFVPFWEAIEMYCNWSGIHRQHSIKKIFGRICCGRTLLDCGFLHTIPRIISSTHVKRYNFTFSGSKGISSSQLQVKGLWWREIGSYRSLQVIQWNEIPNCFLSVWRNWVPPVCWQNYSTCNWTTLADCYFISTNSRQLF